MDQCKLRIEAVFVVPVIRSLRTLLLIFQIYKKKNVQWATKVMTPASIMEARVMTFVGHCTTRVSLNLLRKWSRWAGVLLCAGSNHNKSQLRGSVGCDWRGPQPGRDSERGVAPENRQFDVLQEGPRARSGATGEAGTSPPSSPQEPQQLRKPVEPVSHPNILQLKHWHNL